MRIKIYWIVIFLLSLTACAHRQAVQGSYATPSKQVEGTALGITTGAMLAPFMPEASMLGATATGGYIGNMAGAIAARQRLIHNLVSRGVLVVVEGDNLRIILQTDQFFLQAVPKLNPHQYPTLDYVAALLKEYNKNTTILIAGYTDNIASAQSNQQLSYQRAESLLGYLWVHGIEHAHLKAVGYGEKFPIANNETVSGRAANRRIEIRLREGC